MVGHFLGPLPSHPKARPRIYSLTQHFSEKESTILKEFNLGKVGHSPGKAMAWPSSSLLLATAPRIFGDNDDGQSVCAYEEMGVL